MIKNVISAGGVIYKYTDNFNIEIYFCHHKKYGFVLPKGKLEGNETILECAQREVNEETGYTLLPKQELGQVEYTFELDGEKINKIVHFFAFPYNQQIQNIDSFASEQNINSGKWLKLDEINTQVAHNTEALICLKLKNTTELN